MSDKAPKRIMFYGDSNTFGYDPKAFFGGRYPADIRWTDVVERHMEGRIDVIARGMNGRCIPTSEMEIIGLKKTIRGSMPLDYFAIMLGTNDILLTDNPRPDIAAEKMKRLLMNLLESNLVAEQAPPRCILIVPPLMFPGSPSQGPFKVYEDSSRILAESYRDIGEELNLIVIDASLWNIDLDADGVHISERGSLEFAENLKKELESILG